MTSEGRKNAEEVAAAAAAVTAVFVTGVGLGALAAGVESGWLVLAIGWGVCVPLASGLAFLVASAFAAGADAPNTAEGDSTEPAVSLAAAADEPSEPDPTVARTSDLGRSERS